eukprot:4534-Heterococcus_DN1.PRE.6
MHAALQAQRVIKFAKKNTSLARSRMQHEMKRTIGAAVKLEVHVRTATLGRAAALLAGATKASAAGISRTTAHKHARLHTIVLLAVGQTRLCRDTKTWTLDLSFVLRVCVSSSCLTWVRVLFLTHSSVSATMLASRVRSFACRTAPRCRRVMSSLAALATATAHYDLIVIGSGPSAVACARESARFGKLGTRGTHCVLSIKLLAACPWDNLDTRRDIACEKVQDRVAVPMT